MSTTHGLEPKARQCAQKRKRARGRASTSSSTTFMESASSLAAPSSTRLSRSSINSIAGPPSFTTFTQTIISDKNRLSEGGGKSRFSGLWDWGWGGGMDWRRPFLVPILASLMRPPQPFGLRLVLHGRGGHGEERVVPRAHTLLASLRATFRPSSSSRLTACSSFASSRARRRASSRLIFFSTSPFRSFCRLWASDSRFPFSSSRLATLRSSVALSETQTRVSNLEQKP